MTARLLARILERSHALVATYLFVALCALAFGVLLLDLGIRGGMALLACAAVSLITGLLCMMLCLVIDLWRD